jgi:hypothetical protein
VVEIDAKTDISNTVVSRSGCHTRTRTLFAQGTLLTVRITHEGRRFESDAKVTYAIKGVGMGLHFEHVTTEEEAVLNKWLRRVNSSQDEMAHDAPEIQEDSRWEETKVIIAIFLVAGALISGVSVWLKVLQ